MFLPRKETFDKRARCVVLAVHVQNGPRIPSSSLSGRSTISLITLVCPRCTATHQCHRDIGSVPDKRHDVLRPARFGQRP